MAITSRCLSPGGYLDSLVPPSVPSGSTDQSGIWWRWHSPGGIPHALKRCASSTRSIAQDVHPCPCATRTFAASRSNTDACAAQPSDAVRLSARMSAFSCRDSSGSSGPSGPNGFVIRYRAGAARFPQATTVSGFAADAATVTKNSPLSGVGTRMVLPVSPRPSSPILSGR